MVQLSTLDLSSSNFSGPLPSSFSKITELKEMDLSDNNFIGPIPSLGKAKKLAYIDLSYNGLSGSLSSAQLEGLQSLSVIGLSYNSISGTIPWYLFMLPSFEVVDLSHNQFDKWEGFRDVFSSKLVHFGGLNQSSIIDLSYNSISGSIPSSLFVLPSLWKLYLSNNQFSKLEEFTNFKGPMLLDALMKLNSLLVLDLSFNDIDDVSVTHVELSSSSKITNLKLAFCKLKTFPDIGYYMSRTYYFSLANNNIDGSIPHSLCNALMLEVLDLSHNKISGEVPQCLMKLEVLDVGRNKLAGAFPCFLSYISTLRVLILQNNKFHGRMVCPKDSCVWNTSQIVDVAFNLFSGELPVKWFIGWKKMISNDAGENSKLSHIQFGGDNNHAVYYQDSITFTSRGNKDLISAMKIQEFLSFLVISICVVTDLCVEDDEQSLLLQLKNSLTFNSESSSKLKVWNQSVACCNWSGVTCNDEGHVIGLDLSGESITGGFNNLSSLFDLQHLQSLHLENNNFGSMIPSTFNKLKNLNYLNLSYAGFVGQIPIEISQLTRLVTLDISSRADLTGEEELKLEKPNLGMLVRNLSRIRKLYLDGVTMTSQGEEWCNSLLFLPNLQELSMSSCNLSGPIDASLASLENLSVIRLDHNYLSSTVPETFANLKNLTTLSLSSCGLIGTFPQKIFQVRTLSSIDISYNSNLQGVFPSFQLSGALHTLIVSETSFSGTLPSSLSNLKGLSYLDLSLNNFTGPIPSFGMARKLSYIDLSRNNFSGSIPSSAHFERLQNLISIKLGYNSISGRIPSSLFRLPLLQKIQLSNNQFGQLDELKNVSSSKLNILDLSSNNISGPIPASLFQLTGLSILRLPSNKFNGLMQLNKFLELRNLTTLDLSYNNLSVNVNINLSSIPSISTLKLASCSLKVIPGFLRYQSKLTTLDLSSNQIQGAVPNWIWKLDSLESLNMSRNYLTSLEGPLQNLSSNLIFLDLHSNQLLGPAPVFPKSAAYVDYSNNNFSSLIALETGYLSGTIYLSLANNRFRGSIPYSICNASSLQVLDFSHNNISGTIPYCLIRLSQMLGVLNLRQNNLSGLIPDKFPASCALRTLDLHGNKLEGHIPKSVGNCTTLEVLDLGNNQITDGFPCSLKNISTLRVLVLRKNNFYGNIGCPKDNDTWQMLQIVDLAFNSFNGMLPAKCFRTWEVMMHDEDKADSGVNHLQFEVLKFRQIYYQDSVTVASKGLTMELVKILTVFTSIDFSSNHFQGEIPKELFDFKALYVLNLSNNALSGQIPSSIGNLKQLESLDLSKNSLQGEISTELASLNFLSVLNLSFNQLQGKIPTGTQIQSFLNTSFVGNKGLCGPPLTANCSATHDTFSSVGKQDSAIDWNFISVEVGFIFGLAVVIGPILFCKKWKLKYWQFLDRVLCWIFPHLSLEYERHGGQSYKVLVWRRY
nr:receptor-like protein 7 [Arachis hypogaea]